LNYTIDVLSRFLSPESKFSLKFSLAPQNSDIFALEPMKMAILSNFQAMINVKPEHAAIIAYARWIGIIIDYKFAKF
jgi:hypothetical protein